MALLLLQCFKLFHSFLVRKCIKAGFAYIINMTKLFGFFHVVTIYLIFLELVKVTFNSLFPVAKGMGAVPFHFC